MPVAHDDLYAQSWNTNFGPNPFEDIPSDYTQNNDDVEYVPIGVPKNNHPPSLNLPEKSAGIPVEQSTESEEKNHEEIPQETCDDEAEVYQKTPNENLPEIQTQKTPKNSENTPLQEEPRNARG